MTRKNNRTDAITARAGGGGAGHGGNLRNGTFNAERSNASDKGKFPPGYTAADYAAHMCACGKWGAFGRPGPDGKTVWACCEHRRVAEPEERAAEPARSRGRLHKQGTIL